MTEEYSTTFDKLKVSIDTLLTINRNIEELQKQISSLTEEYKLLSRNVIPELLEELGLQEVVSSGGLAVSIRERCTASVRKDYKQEAYGWLEDNGYGDIVRNTLIADIGKGNLDAATSFQDHLRAEGIPATLEKKIHPQTFQKFATDLIDGGGTLPEELFSTHIWQEAIISRV